jgi:hypothetical protein
MGVEQVASDVGDRLECRAALHISIDLPQRLPLLVERRRSRASE